MTLDYSKQPSISHLLAFAHQLSPQAFSSTVDVEIRNDGPTRSFYDLLDAAGATESGTLIEEECCGL